MASRRCALNSTAPSARAGLAGVDRARGGVSAWHPTPARFEPRVGGRVAYVGGGHIADMPDGEVTDYDPPRLLGYTWNADEAESNHLRFEIRPHDAGSVLILTHTFEDRLKAARG